MPLRQQVGRAIGYLGRSFQAAAHAGQTISQFVGQALDRLTGLGITPPPLDQAAVDQVAGWANSLEAARTNFANADPEQLIDASMISTRYPTIDLQAFNAAPAFRARVFYTLQGDDAEYSMWIGGIDPRGQTTAQFQQALQLTLIGMLPDTGPAAGTDVQLSQVTGVQIVRDAPPVY